MAITSLSPSSGVLAQSSPLTINGSGFGATSFAASVTIDNTYASITSWSDTSITVTSPSNFTTPGAIPVTVYLAGGAFSTNAVNFIVGNLPTITQISPDSGPLGTLVTITGSNFGSTQ
ncbi:MAG TPA: IPT/TIG domain-containing protein, partial [Terriglobales bacterium]